MGHVYGDKCELKMQHRILWGMPSCHGPAGPLPSLPTGGQKRLNWSDILAACLSGETILAGLLALCVCYEPSGRVDAQAQQKHSPRDGAMQRCSSWKRHCWTISTPEKVRFAKWAAGRDNSSNACPCRANLISIASQPAEPPAQPLPGGKRIASFSSTTPHYKYRLSSAAQRARYVTLTLELRVEAMPPGAALPGER